MNRINITCTTDCCGCGACVQKCPKMAISMRLDAEGFGYPVINDALCIDCGACVKVCHWKKDNYAIHPVVDTKSYCAYNKDGEVLKESSSGGIFWVLAEHIISNGGVVYGALADGFKVHHSRVDTLEKCTVLRKSKYLQSDTMNTYAEAKKDLQEGKSVLFSGTPCQIAGLYSFLGMDYDNLFTCEVVCHGVPSLKAFNRWLDELTIKYGSKPVSMVWRDKCNGWGPNHITYFFENATKVSTTSQNSLFQKGFLDNLYLRPSCYECHYARLPRIADVTLADFWGYNGPLKERNGNKGLSIVVISTKKGCNFLERIQHKLVIEQVNIEYVKQLSRHVWLHPENNPKRANFFRDLDNVGFTKAAKKHLYPTKCKTFVLKIYSELRKLF